MKRIVLLLTLAFATCFVSAQKKKQTKTAQVLPTISLSDAISQYRFDEAEKILNNEITTLRRKNLDITDAENRLRNVQRAKKRMQATEQICFIDSVKVSKNKMLSDISLSDEVGQLDTYSNYYQKSDSMDCTLYISQMKDQIITALPQSSTTLLAISQLVGDEWSKPSLLNNLGLEQHADRQQNYPYLLNDGCTLYYAAKGEESMGGYDIFMTRYDAEEKHFLAPENIGMPFNSPANDYLYVIDEYSNLGWFVTDRNCSSDSVCVYTFIPNKSRRIYNQESISYDQLRMFAKLNSIRDTWIDASIVEEAKSHLNEIRHSTSSTNAANTAQTGFSFVINDQTTYTSVDQFVNPTARQLAIQYVQNQEKLSMVSNILDQLRDRYAANPNQRTTLSQDILNKESEKRQLINLIAKQAKELRSLELSH